MAEPRPGFLMVGVPRGGSTAVQASLQQHPDIFLPPLKETHFFSAGADVAVPSMHALGIYYRECEDPALYFSYFADAVGYRRCGEVDPSILVRAPHAIPKIKKFLGTDLKQIIVLRQPVERAFSHHALHLGLAIESRPLESYIDVVTPRDPLETIALDRYFRSSFYAHNVKLFFEAFGREKFLVLLYDDLCKDPQAYIKTILEFIGADTGTIPMPKPETNASLVPKNLIGRMRTPWHPLRRFMRACVPPALRAGMRRAVEWETRASRDFGKGTLSVETRARLQPRYREDILRVQDLIGRDLTHWLK